MVVAAAPLGGDAPSASAASAVASGGVRTEDDPSGRGLAVDPVAGGNRPGYPGADGSASHVEGPRGWPEGPSGGTRSAGPRQRTEALATTPVEPGARADGHHGGGSGSSGNDGDGPSEHDQKPDAGPGTNPNGHDHDGGKGGDTGSGGTGDKGSSGTGSGGTGSGDGSGRDGSDGKSSGDPSGKGSGSTSH